jgi:di/tricarboxylate transporter
MTLEMGLVLFILALAVLMLVTEWVAMEVTALLVLVTLVVAGLVPAIDALAGFSNPAVITVWAVFILSSGLTHTGVANIIGRWVLRLSGRHEAAIITVVMASSGLMSAFMNNVAVAALMLPVVMDISRQTGHSPSRLMLPLAYGSLLGGLTTMIGTPPNLLVSNVLHENGLTSFRLFDFTPVGLAVMVAGIGFTALVGRHLLPRRNIVDAARQNPAASLERQYHLRERMFTLTVPPGAALIGGTLAESRLGSILGITVIGITRGEHTLLSPGPDVVLSASDRLIVEGSLDNFQQLRDEIAHWSGFNLVRAAGGSDGLISETLGVAEVALAPEADLTGKTLRESGVHTRLHINVLAVDRGGSIHTTDLQDLRLAADDTLLVHGSNDRLQALAESPHVRSFTRCATRRLREVYHLDRHLLTIKIPDGSLLDGQTLRESRLGAALGIRVLAVATAGEGNLRIATPDHRLQSGDVLMVQGSAESITAVKSLSDLTVSSGPPARLDSMETEEVGLMEAILHPHGKVAGKSLADLRFREKYGVSVLAVWREGRPVREREIRDLALRVGDALLLYGPRDKFALVGAEPDFVVLTETAQEVPNFRKAKISLAVMAAVLVPVVAGWLPIYISALMGAALMVISGCLTMEEAHRSIEWKGIILIAGMLPLGTALDSTGTASLLAQKVVALLGPLGPTWVMAGLMVLTFAGTCVIPTAALVVLMGPIVISTAAGLGVSPHALVMAVAVAASASFMTPISHPANIMVMGPGGYRFADYLKVGIPLTVVVLAVGLLVLPIFWPL